MAIAGGWGYKGTKLVMKKIKSIKTKLKLK